MESKSSSESSKNKDEELGNKNKSLYRLGAIVTGAATGIGLLAWGLSALASSAGSESEEKKKTMKAPGKDEIIEREEFERDPKGYFRDLRNNGEKKKTMKAPGKDEIIEREEFERDPKGYFRDLRNNGSESEEKKKTTKAPGKDEIIEREKFERDPKGYFRDLRNK